MNKKHEESLKKTSRTIFFAVSGSLLAVFLYFSLNGYRNDLKNAKATVLSELQAVVRAASLEFSPQDIAYLKTHYTHKNAIQKNEDDSVYLKLHQKLAQIYDIQHLTSPVYLLTYVPEEEHFVFLATSSVNPYYYHAYKNFPDELKKSYSKGTTIDLYKDENGSWLSAFAPIKDKEGNTVAIVQADQSFDKFMAGIKHKLWNNLLFALLVVVLVKGLLFMFMQRIIKKENDQRRVLIEQNEEIKAQKEELEQQSHWIGENNKKLEEARATIEKQNKELKIINQMLDFKVQQRTEELEVANEDLGEFLYRSSHDIMGPVATLSGLIHLGKVEFEGSDFEEYVSRFDGTVGKLKTIIRSINAVYEIKNRSVASEMIFISQFIKGITSVYETKAREKNIRIQVKCKEELAIYSDPFLLEKMLHELLQNAIHYFPDDKENGRIRIEAEMTKNDRFRLVVSDNGSGIEDGMDKDIFRKFKRASDLSQGSGLGLYMVTLAVEKLKGIVKLLKNEEPGATFVIRFQARADREGV